MSFEFYGGIIAKLQLEQFSAPQGQADSVCEAIIRHQDPVEEGTITTIGLLVQLATQFGQYQKHVPCKCELMTVSDNMAYRSEYIHPDTIKDVVARYPRREWSRCFSIKIREEVLVKPWCHTTASTEKFPHDVQHNALMEPYDGLY